MTQVHIQYTNQFLSSNPSNDTCIKMPNTNPTAYQQDRNDRSLKKKKKAQDSGLLTRYLYEDSSAQERLTQGTIYSKQENYERVKRVIEKFEKDFGKRQTSQ
ncbi:hypothetical protein ACMFMG_001144 [Clarireedia jacksonii]